MREITISQAAAPSEYLPQIDRKEADGDLIHAVLRNDEGVYAVLHQGAAVGLALLEKGRNAFLYLYIFPPYRRRGFGRAAALLAEQELSFHDPIDISTCWRAEDPAACSFAGQCGYQKEFSSDHMVYTGPRFEAAKLPVRGYRDEDYPEAQALSEEAFHQMRLGTGCFPDSVPEPPSEADRKYWADTAAERLVYLEGGEVIGCAHLQGDEISSVSVKPGCQGKGVGKAFLQHIINRLIDAGHPRISLYCVVGNSRAQHLYDSLGFARAYRNVYAKKRIK